jgi:hypothetical protein
MTIVFCPEQYFQTPCVAHGVVIDLFGVMRTQFTARMTGRWDAVSRTLYLNEEFVFDDGRTDTREWILEKQPGGTYNATASDNPGHVSYATVRGNALYMDYPYTLCFRGMKIKTRYQDWLWLMPDGKTILNRSRITKWGIPIAQVVASFVPDRAA